MGWSESEGELEDGELVPRHGRGRRQSDNPDWKVAAPRWLLVLLAGAFVVGLADDRRTHIARLDNTAMEVSALANRTSALERGMQDAALEIATTREDMLSFQLYTAKRMRADERFVADLEARHERAKARVDQLENSKRAALGLPRQ